MKLLSLALVLLLSFQAFGHDRREPRRDDRRGEHRGDHRGDHRHDRRDRGSDDGLFDLSTTLLLTTLTFDDEKQAAQINNDAQDFIQTGRMSLLLNQKIIEIQSIDETLSVEDSLDLILSYTK